MNEYQKQFCQYMGMIQETAVQIALSKYQEGNDIENLLYNTTYEVIIDIMTLIDGYSNFGDGQMDIVNMQTGIGLKENPFIELHDTVCSYLKYEK